MSNRGPRLSPALASTYRLFLRGISAAVLNHRTARKNIRRLYRETFVDAAEIEHRLSYEQDPRSRHRLEQWLQQWNQKADNTLEFFLASATNRGLSHRITRNMSFISPPNEPVMKWNSYNGKVIQSKKRDVKRDFAYRPLVEVVRLAEGFGDLHLGRLAIKNSQSTSI